MAKLAPGPLLAALVLSACAAPTPRSPPQAHADKEALYGDPGLMPTREGERRRREIAYASEIDGALALLPVREHHVDVELAADPNAPPRILIVATVGPGAPTDLPDRIRTVVDTVVGPVPDPGPTLILSAAPAGGDEGPTPAPVTWLLSLALLGFGFNLGIAYDRARRRRVRSSTP